MDHVELEGVRSPGFPDGECILTRLEDGRLRVDHADPRVLISAEVLELVRAAPAEGVSLDMGRRVHRDSYVGAVLRIAAVNQTVIYRVTGEAWSVHGYIGEWPD